jgi:hypothetical protein
MLEKYPIYANQKFKRSTNMEMSKSQASSQSQRYFFVAVDMLISEGVSKVVIAKSAKDARRKVERDIISQDFSEWHAEGQEIKSAAEVTYIDEITYQQFIDYKNRL